MKIKEGMDLIDIMQIIIDELHKQEREQKRQKKKTARLRGEVRRLRKEILNRDVHLSLSKHAKDKMHAHAVATLLIENLGKPLQRRTQ